MSVKKGWVPVRSVMNEFVSKCSYISTFFFKRSLNSPCFGEIKSSFILSIEACSIFLRRKHCFHVPYSRRVESWRSWIVEPFEILNLNCWVGKREWWRVMESDGVWMSESAMENLSCWVVELLKSFWNLESGLFNLNLNWFSCWTVEILTILTCWILKILNFGFSTTNAFTTKEWSLLVNPALCGIKTKWYATGQQTASVRNVVNPKKTTTPDRVNHHQHQHSGIIRVTSDST